jgi:hypothetical protein
MYVALCILPCVCLCACVHDIHLRFAHGHSACSCLAQPYSLQPNRASPTANIRNVMVFVPLLHGNESYVSCRWRHYKDTHARQYTSLRAVVIFANGSVMQGWITTCRAVSPAADEVLFVDFWCVDFEHYAAGVLYSVLCHSRSYELLYVTSDITSNFLRVVNFLTFSINVCLIACDLYLFVNCKRKIFHQHGFLISTVLRCFGM